MNDIQAIDVHIHLVDEVSIKARGGRTEQMARYIVKRILLMVPTLLGVAVIIFLLMRVVPGDVVELRFAGESSFASKENLDKERVRLGLDKPMWQQFVTWMWGIVRLDFGQSMWTGAPITEEIRLRFALSLQLAIMATVIAVVLAIPLGVLAALEYKERTGKGQFIEAGMLRSLKAPSLNDIPCMVPIVSVSW